MRVILSFFFLSLCLSSIATAGTDPILYQVKSSRLPASAKQPSFWDLLSGRAQLEADLSVKVTDAETGLPLAGTAVLVGSANGIPFPGNIVRTDEQGVATFTNELLRNGNPFPITAGKSGYSILSVFSGGENKVELALQRIPGERDYGFMQGKLTGFPSGVDSGTLEIGLFLPATRPEGLLNFDLSLFISTYKVKIDVYGEREVPGNTVLPTQSKQWGFIPVNISKPEFIMPLPKGLETHMAGLVGSVPISPAVSAIQNKDFLSVLNITSFNRVGWTPRRMTVKGDEKFNLSANLAVNSGALVSKVSNVPEKLDVVSISLVDPEGDRGDFVAMDMKALKAEEIKNGTAQFKLGMIKNRLQGAAYYIFIGIFDRKQLSRKSPSEEYTSAASPDYRWIVGATKPVGSERSADTRFSAFLKQMRPAAVSNGNRDYKFSSATTSKLTPDLTVVNIISEKQNALTRGVVRTVLWSAVTTGSVTELSLPDLGRPVLPTPDTTKGERFFWEVVAMKLRSPPPGTPTPEHGIDLQTAVRNVEHVSSFTKAF